VTNTENLVHVADTPNTKAAMVTIMEQTILLLANLAAANSKKHY
jgi:hypothetical protein